MLTQEDSGELTEKGEAQFPENELLLRQLIYADKILLNKVDLLGEKKEEMLEEIEEVVRKVNPNAEITQSSYAAVGLEFLLE